MYPTPTRAPDGMTSGGDPERFAGIVATGSAVMLSLSVGEGRSHGRGGEERDGSPGHDAGRVGERPLHRWGCGRMN